MNKSYAVSRSMMVKCVTVAVWIVYLIVLFTVDFTGHEAAKNICVFVALSITLFGILSISPRRIEIDNQGIVVKRIIGSKKFSFNEISEVGLSYSPSYLRVCGSGGFCGYLGWFKSPGFGTFFSYVGDKNQAFYIALKNGRKYMLSCEEYDDVVVALSDMVSKLNPKE